MKDSHIDCLSGSNGGVNVIFFVTKHGGKAIITSLHTIVDILLVVLLLLLSVFSYKTVKICET